MSVEPGRQNRLAPADLYNLAHALRLLADDASLIAAQGAESNAAAPGGTMPARSGMTAAAELLAFAKSILAARRKISQFFDPQLFADPARDMLLDLFVAGEEGRVISVSSCCIGAAVPATTALRWIKTLKTAGLVVEIGDAADRRRRLVTLSDHARDQVIRYLSSIDRRPPDHSAATPAAPQSPG